MRSAIVDHMERDQKVLVPLTLLVCVVLLFVAFRWWPAAVLPVVGVGVTALLVLGGMALAGEPLNVLNNIIPPLLIIISSISTDSSRERRVRPRGANRLVAMPSLMSSPRSSVTMTCGRTISCSSTGSGAGSDISTSARRFAPKSS